MFADTHVDRVIELIQDHILQIEDKDSMVAVSYTHLSREQVTNWKLGCIADWWIQ